MRRAQTNSRVHFRTVRLTCPLLFTTLLLLSDLTTLHLPHSKDAPFFAATVCFTYFWNLRQAGDQTLKRAKKAKPAPYQCAISMFQTSNRRPLISQILLKAITCSSLRRNSVRPRSSNPDQQPSALRSLPPMHFDPSFFLLFAHLSLHSKRPVPRYSAVHLHRAILPVL